MLFVVLCLSLVGSTLTSSLSKRGGSHHASLINCPTCVHHVCDFHNLMHCEVCEIHKPHENQPPESVKCAQPGHCHEDNHKHCCDNEGCVANYFGQLASSAVTQPASSMQCPHCHEGICDFINRDQCFGCRIDLKNDGTHHVHCLKEHERCDPTHQNTFCCSDEPCIAQAFGHDYPTSHSTISTTKSATSTLPTNSSATATTTSHHSSTLSSTTTVRTTNTNPQTNPTSTDGHKTYQTKQLLNYIPCPVLSCTHHKCDLTSTNLCEVCHIAFNHQQQPQETKCLTVEHHCKDGTNQLCCTDMACVENVFGNNPKFGASSNGSRIYCPDCKNHGCDFISCETCVYHNQIHHDIQMYQFKTCGLKGTCINEAICCHDYNCIDALFGTHFQSTLSPTQSTTIPSVTSKPTVQASTTKAHTSSDPTTNAYTTSTAATMTTTKGQTTKTDTTTPNIATSVSSNGQPTHQVSSDATSTYRTSTTAPSTTTSSTNGANNSCVDELNNCAMFKSMGVCHASPQEGTKYDIVFQCKLTCDRCNETYKPLTTTASTIPTTIGTPQATIHCQVCGDYDNNIPCDLVSVFKGSFVACTEGAYCMNDVVHEQGNVKTFKRCVNETVCRNLWMSQSSDQDHCTNYGNVMVSGDYSCHFCCTTDKCNRGITPDPSTYYINA